jgi:HK97 family phage prohead protease
VPLINLLTEEILIAMSEKEVKAIDFELKQEAEGKVSAVFSVFNSLDSDGDVVLPGSIKSGFKSGDVPMVWAHKWDMPIGKGRIKEDDGKATFDGEFFMDTDSGQEAYKIVKNMGDMQQWSFGYRVNDAERAPFKSADSEDEQDARYLKDLTVFEVSPVLVGANQDTYTMAIKSNKELVEDLVEDEKKSVLGSGSFQKEEPEAEVPSEEPSDEPTEEVVEEEEKSITVDMLIENPALYLKELQKVRNSIKEATIETQESEEIEVSEKSQTFSEQVKDVLAALDDLMVRATAIAMLRAKDGRTLGTKATEALRAVQEDLSDAWVELDQFIENVGSEPAEVLELEVEEQQPVEDVVEDEDPSDDVEVEEVETSEEPEVESPEAVTDDNSESSDDDFDAEWLEGQSLLADTVDIDITEEDEPVL